DRCVANHPYSRFVDASYDQSHGSHLSQHCPDMTPCASSGSEAMTANSFFNAAYPLIVILAWPLKTHLN
ncbi:MAG: hypothetical protein ACXW3Q_14480, partial [Rhodoplanes sp.]